MDTKSLYDPHLLARWTPEPSPRAISATHKKRDIGPTADDRIAKKKNGISRQIIGDRFEVCDQPVVSEPPLSGSVSPNRAEFIIRYRKKWVNGTVLHYYFFDDPNIGSNIPENDPLGEWVSWAGAEEQKQAVRDAFSTWKAVGIGLEFKEVSKPQDAELRIGFQKGAGSWSYLGRDSLGISALERTMNFGWSLLTEWGRETALHEIGHAIGLPHEHQNPNTGIEWIPEAVYAAFDYWPPEKVEYNILRKIEPYSVRGSSWDPESIMHYPFEPKLIRNEPYFTNGLYPPPGLSGRDKKWIRHFYPGQAIMDRPELLPVMKSQILNLTNGQQADFLIRPDGSRKYTIRTFGKADTVLVLFELVDGTPHYRSGDDNSGDSTNAEIALRLEHGHEYIIRVRSYYAENPGQTAIMYW